MQDGFEPRDERSLRDSYAEFLARAEGGEPIEFETWVRQYGDDADRLRRMHGECQALEARLDEIAVESSSETLFFSTPRESAGVGPAAKGMPRPKAGLRIGDYRLISRLGKGGMGEVWEAVHFGLQRRVALKLLDPERFTERGVSFFDREARAGARVHDVGIVAVHAAGEDAGFLWIDQELVEGGRTLADFLSEMRARNSLPEDYYHEIASFVADVARSMQVAHDNFVVHRDLKPQNILIGPDDKPKITDFGLARLTDEKSVSMTGDLVGTYQYMSPEQLQRGPSRIDHRSDIFSLGVVLYELLTLARPFQAGSTQEIAARILYARELDPCSAREGVPRGLGTICVRALEKSQNDRFDSMRELADELERWLGGLPIHSRPPGPFSGLRLWRRKHPTRAATLAVTLLAAAILVPLWRELLVTSEGERDARYTAYVEEVRYAGTFGDLQGAQSKFDLAIAINPHDPEVYLVFAERLAELGEGERARELLGTARVLGFRPLGAAATTPVEHFLDGLHWMLERRTRENREKARDAFARALEIEPKHRGANFGLYSVALALGEIDTAREALVVFQGRLENAEPLNGIVECLLLEIDGDVDEAITRLEEWRVEHELQASNDRVVFNTHRIMGRLAVSAGDLQLACRELEAALEDFPQDVESLTNLATAKFLFGAHSSPGVARDAAFTDALHYAERGLELEAGNERDLRTRAMAAAQVLQVAVLEQRDVPDGLWRRAQQALEEFAAVFPDDPFVNELRSERLFTEAATLELDGGDAEDFLPLLEEAARLDPGNLRAQYYLAENRFFEGQTSGVLEPLELALAAWNRAQEPPPATPGRPIPRSWPPEYGYKLHVWILLAAVREGQPERADQAWQAMDHVIESGIRIPADQLLNFAEGLALLSELADDPDPPAMRALEIVEQFELRRRFGRDPEGAKILNLIERISHR